MNEFKETTLQAPEELDFLVETLPITNHKRLMTTSEFEMLLNQHYNDLCRITRGRVRRAISKVQDLENDSTSIAHEAMSIARQKLRVSDEYSKKDLSENFMKYVIGVMNNIVRDEYSKIARDERVKANYVARIRGLMEMKMADERLFDEGRTERLVVELTEVVGAERLDLLMDIGYGYRKRLDVIAESGVNPNTFDTRIRNTRKKLKKYLDTN